VGFVLHKKIGDTVTTGESLATVHVASEEAVQVAMRHVRAAFQIGEARVEPLPTVLEVIQ
jgi:thymidine phosphorylase